MEGYHRRSKSQTGPWRAARPGGSGHDLNNGSRASGSRISARGLGPHVHKVHRSMRWSGIHPRTKRAIGRRRTGWASGRGRDRRHKAPPADIPIVSTDPIGHNMGRSPKIAAELVDATLGCHVQPLAHDSLKSLCPCGRPGDGQTRRAASIRANVSVYPRRRSRLFSRCPSPTPDAAHHDRGDRLTDGRPPSPKATEPMLLQPAPGRSRHPATTAATR